MLPPANKKQGPHEVEFGGKERWELTTQLSYTDHSASYPPQHYSSRVSHTPLSSLFSLFSSRLDVTIVPLHNIHCVAVRGETVLLTGRLDGVSIVSPGYCSELKLLCGSADL